MTNTLAEQIITSNFDIFFLAVDKYLNIESNYGLTNLFSLYSNHQKFANSGQLLSDSETIELIQNTTAQSHHQVAIVPFKPSAKTEFICRQQGWKYLANSSRLNRHLEDKLNFVDICHQHQIPSIPSSVAPLTRQNFKKYQQTYQQPNLVIQTHFGWAGQSTFQATDFSQIASIIPPNTPVKFSPFLSGYTLLNNCCLTHLGLLVSPPALQFTGIPGLTTNPFTTVGRQWPSFALQPVIDQIKQISDAIGIFLTSLSYQGFFGLDFFVDQSQHVFLLEINPRLTASYSYYTQLEMQSGLTPFFFYHLAEFLKLPYTANINVLQSLIDHATIQGTEITPKDNRGHTRQKIHFSAPITKSTKHSIITRSLNELQI